MNPKYFWLVLVLAMTGCKHAQPPKQSENAADKIMKLAKSRPSLKKICDLSNGCSNVEIECKDYDDTGNTVLRNIIVWHVTALGIEGDGWHDKGGHDAGQFAAHIGLDGAIKMWFELHDHPTPYSIPSPSSVFPNSKPCDEVTLCGGRP